MTPEELHGWAALYAKLGEKPHSEEPDTDEPDETYWQQVVVQIVDLKMRELKMPAEQAKFTYSATYLANGLKWAAFWVSLGAVLCTGIVHAGFFK